MRRIITGEGADGRSRVIADDVPAATFRFGAVRSGEDPHAFLGTTRSPDIASPGTGEVVVAELWRTGAVPERSWADPTAADGAYDVEVQPGQTRWRLVQMGPNLRRPMHRTATLDCDVVLSGSVDLVLDEGEVHLVAGDAIVIPGINHAWRTGDDGCVLALTMFGLAEAAAS